MRLHAPAAERNAGPILEILRTVLPRTGCVLEIASGTGQHCAAFASALTNLTFQPSEGDASKLDSIRSWAEGLANVEEPIVIDVTAPTWPVGTVDAVFCANMIHIAPIEAMYGLLEGAGRHLASGGLLAIYGPFMRNGHHTAPSNEAFDASLRSRDPRWGIRDLETVKTTAQARGLSFDGAVEMPANNKTVLFRRGAKD